MKVLPREKSFKTSLKGSNKTISRKTATYYNVTIVVTIKKNAIIKANNAKKKENSLLSTLRKSLNTTV